MRTTHKKGALVTLSIVLAMATMIFTIWILALVNLRTRVRAAKAREVDHRYFKAYEESFNVPEKIRVLGRHYDNQFQLPLLFLMSCLAVLQLQAADIWTAVFTWAFVLSRWLHTYIHLGSNKVLTRAKAFALGWFFIVLIWIKILLTVS